MVVVSISYKGMVYLILIKKKITTIRLKNRKWDRVYQKFQEFKKLINEVKKIPITFYFKQRSQYSFKFLDSTLLKIEDYDLRKMTEEDAKLDGAGNKKELLSFFEETYDEENKSYLDKEYVRIFWDLDFIFDEEKINNIIPEKLIAFFVKFIDLMITNEPDLFEMPDINTLLNIIKKGLKRTYKTRKKKKRSNSPLNKWME